MFKDDLVHFCVKISEVGFPEKQVDVLVLGPRGPLSTDVDALANVPSLTLEQGVAESPHISRAMLPLLQLTLIRPAVTPEDVCVLWDGTVLVDQPVRLQVLVPVFSPVVRLEFRDFVPLDEDELGLAGQRGAAVGVEQRPDGVHMQAGGV